LGNADLFSCLVRPHGHAQQIANFGIALLPAEQRIEQHQHKIGHAQAKRASNLYRDHLGNKGQRSLSRTSHLYDIQCAVIRFDQAGLRAAFAQRPSVLQRRFASAFGKLRTDPGRWIC
jgi:hypothetical protein